MKNTSKILILWLLGSCSLEGMAQNDPSGIFQKLQKSVEKKLEKNLPNNPPVQPPAAPAPVDSAKPSQTAATVSPNSKQSGEDHCAKIASDPSLNNIAATLMKAKEAGVESRFDFLDSEGLATKWIEDRFSGGDSLGRKTVAIHILNNCAYDLLKRDQKNIFLFMKPGKNLPEAQGLRAFEILEADPRYNPKPVKSIDGNGNVVMTTPVAQKIDWYKAPKLVSWDDKHPPMALAILFPNGEKVLQNADSEFSRQAENKYSEITNEKKLASEKAIREEEAKAASKAAEAEAKKKRFAEYKNGDYKSLKLCFDLGEAYASESGLTLSLKPALSPSNIIVVGKARLEKFQESGNSGDGYIKEAGQYVSVKSNAKTAWIDKANIKIDSDVCFAGRYVKNAAVTLTSGASQQIMVLETMCMQSGRSCDGIALERTLK